MLPQPDAWASWGLLGEKADASVARFAAERPT
jgi:hypothetical protein